MPEKSEKPNFDTLFVHLYSGPWEFIGQVGKEDFDNLFDCRVVTLIKPTKVMYNAQRQMVLFSLVNHKEIKSNLRVRVDAHLILNELGNVYESWRTVVSPIVKASPKDRHKLKLA